MRLDRVVLVSMLALAPGPALLAQGVLGFPAEHLPVQIQNVGSGQCLQVRGAAGDGAVLEQWTCGPDHSQTWFLIALGATEYQLRPGHLGNVRPGITSESLADEAAARLVNGDYPSQVFRFVPAGNDTYDIVAKRSGKCLDVTSAGGLGAEVQQWSCSAAPHQRWRILPREAPLHLVAKHSQKCLEVSGASFHSFAPVQQWDCLGSQQDSQGWTVELAGTDGGLSFWRLKARHSGLCLDQNWWSGGEIVQNDCHPAYDSQLWTLVGGADGHVDIRSYSHGWCLEVGGADTASGAAVRSAPCSGADNQRFFWARNVRRHVVLIQPVSTATGQRHLADLAEFAAAVERANSVYRRYGIELLFDPATDVVDALSDALFNLSDPGTWNAFYQCMYPWYTNRPKECATAYGQFFGHGIVTVLGSGNNAGFSGGHETYIFWRGTVPHGQDPCGTASPYNTVFAHEVGHYFGLSHTYRWYGASHDAGLAYQNSGYDRSIFDNDLLPDTHPDPGNGGTCLAPTAPTGILWLHWYSPGPFVSWYSASFEVHTQNIMSPPYFHVEPAITPQQAAIVRATAFARGL